jgi:hypothetical protein
MTRGREKTRLTLFTSANTGSCAVSFSSCGVFLRSYKLHMGCPCITRKIWNLDAASTRGSSIAIHLFRRLKHLNSDAAVYSGTFLWAHLRFRGNLSYTQAAFQIRSNENSKIAPRRNFIRTINHTANGLSGTSYRMHGIEGRGFCALNRET